MTRVVLSALRLDLMPLSAEAIVALMDGDRARLETVAGARFPTPLAAPPLMADALPTMRDLLLTDPESRCWGPYLMVLRETRQAVGSAGFSGGPADGVVTLGYSVYPEFGGRGFASEAASALVAWAASQPGVKRVEATIPPPHAASQAVAARAGLRRTGRMESDPDEGPVEVWERFVE